MKHRLEKLHQIAQLRKDMDLAALARVQAQCRANQLARAEVADARGQSRFAATQSPHLGQTADRFERWTDQQDRALVQQQTTLDQSQQDHLKCAADSFGRATVIGAILRK